VTIVNHSPGPSRGRCLFIHRETGGDFDGPSRGIEINICREFGVNENWLTTGTGPMYNDDPKISEVKEFYRSKASLGGAYQSTGTTATSYARLQNISNLRDCCPF
jgi:hypothetical protein